MEIGFSAALEFRHYRKTMKTVSRAHFNYLDFAPEHRLRAFREMTSSAYEIWATGDDRDFAVEAVGYQLGGLLFNEMKCSPARFLRGPRHLSGGQSNFLLLQAQLSGSELIEMKHGIIRVQPDHIYLRDWSFPFESDANTMHLRSIVIPRHLLKSSIVLSESNPVLSWPMNEPKGCLLTELWWRLVAEFEGVDLGTAEALCRGFLGFLDGLIGGIGYGAADEQVKLRSMEQYLQAQLRGDVGIAQLCERFSVSRATVFRLFKKHGGVSRYLNRLRLDRCFSELRAADPKRTTVSEIAAGWGYIEPRAFLRRFRSQFGKSPSEVLGSGFTPPAAANDSERSPFGEQALVLKYASWLQNAGAFPHSAE